MSPQASRACKALVILGVGFALIVLSATCARNEVPAKANHVVQSVTTGAFVLQDALTDSTHEEHHALNGEQLVERLFVSSGGSIDGHDAVPSAFVRECFDPSALGASRVAYRNGVVGASYGSGVEETFDACVKEITLHGWTIASKNSSETICLCSLSKQNGSYSWIYLLCQPAGESTSVVVLAKEA